MRITVLGNSASSGIHLPDHTQAWPWLAKAALEQHAAVEVHLTHENLVPNGPGAARYAMTKIETSDPDLVVLVVSSYLCSIALVSERIRQRFGNRAHRWYRGIERRFDSGTRPDGGAPGRANSLARRIARKVIGVRPFATAESVSQSYEEIILRLASREGMHVVVLAEPSWPDWVDNENRGANVAWRTVMARTAAAAAKHHFPFVETSAAYATAATTREAFDSNDGVHKTIAGHDRQAAALIPILLDPATGILNPTRD